MNVKSSHTLDELLKLYKTESSPRLARRIHAVYLACKGLTCPQIINITGAGRRTIQKWVKRYNYGSIEELKDKPRPGQPTKLPAQMEEAFCQRIQAGPLEQDGVSVLNGPAIKRLMEREFGVVYSLWGVYSLLHRLRLSCLCPRPQHEKADPDAQQEFKKSSLRRWMRSKQNIRTRR
jgi:transposase